MLQKENACWKKPAALIFRKQGHPQASEGGQGWEETNVSDTLNIYDNSENRTPTIIVDKAPPRVYDWHRCDTRMTDITDIGCTMSASWGTGGNNVPMVDNGSVVRRLTPLECERLQGFPDGWTDIGEWVDTKGKKHKDADSPRYKALGNSIALPFWDWMAQRMVSVLREEGISDPKMASLFDGIGGFPLVFSHHGCTPVWASEIEEFPIAVTKRRFPDGE